MIVGLDTALQNSGLVILDKAGVCTFAGKPFSKEEGKTLERTARIARVLDWVQENVDLHQVDLFAMEDYILTGHQKAYETAELLGNLKIWLFRARKNHILVHPSKTLKYVVKRKEVPKGEIIEYVKARDPGVFNWVKPVDYSDVADAWVIAQIGRMAHDYIQMSKTGQSFNYEWEERWTELMLTDGSGILTKPGLCVTF